MARDAGIRWSPAYPLLICYVDITTSSQVVEWIEANRIATLNVAGNRDSVGPWIGERAERFLLAVFRRLAEG